MGRVNYRKIWEKFNKACILPGMHIHHKDGNRRNNSPNNLIVCTPEEHIEFHRKRGDKIGENFIFMADSWSSKTNEERSQIKKKISKKVKGKNLGRKHTAQSRRNMSEAHKGNPGWWEGKSLPKESVEKMRKSKTGVPRSKEARQKCKMTMLSKEYNKRSKHFNSKKIMCLQTHRVWGCIRDASDDLGINYTTLKQFLQKPRENTKFEILKYLRYV